MSDKSLLSSEVEILTQLRSQLVSFFDELIQAFPKEEDFIIIRIFVKDKIPIMDIMSYIVQNLLPLQSSIQKRDDSFFVNNNILFEKLDSKKVNYFKKLWLSPEIDAKDKETIWQWFTVFIVLATQYVKIKSENKNK
jgi:hypothetical protein